LGAKTGEKKDDGEGAGLKQETEPVAVRRVNDKRVREKGQKRKKRENNAREPRTKNRGVFEHA